MTSIIIFFYTEQVVFFLVVVVIIRKWSNKLNYLKKRDEFFWYIKLIYLAVCNHFYYEVNSIP